MNKQPDALPVATVNRIKGQVLKSTSTFSVVAGGTNSANAEDYARAGADILVTSAPYFSPPRDVAVTLTAL